MAPITTHASLKEFFLSKVREALFLEGLDVSPEVEFYLVQILSHFADAQNLYQQTQDGKIEDRPLALRLHDAVFDKPSKRFHHLKTLGDTALYQAGVFYDGLANQVVNVDYYITMGGHAYQSLANLTTSTEKPLSDLFAELSETFHRLVEILHIVCEAEKAGSAPDLLRLLDRYQKTKSEKARKILAENGLNPDALLVSKDQQ